MTLPTPATRVHVAQSLRGLVGWPRALAVEHACYSLTAAQPTAASYERLALRTLQLLETCGNKLDELGPLLFVGAPLELLVGCIPARAEILQQEQERRRSSALLRDLKQGEMADLGNKGLRCKRCDSNEVTFEFLQTRSADEGTTVFCTCSKCGRRWKM